VTCIIGLKENGKTFIGADSSASNHWEQRVTMLPKVFRNGKFVLGYTGSFRMGQILQHHLEVPQQENESDDHYLVKHFIESVRVVLRDLGFSKIENNQQEGGTFLLAFNGNIYTIEADFQINSYEDNLDAIGASREYALGAMIALSRLEPEKRIKKSLEIASRFSCFVKPPYIVYSS
jgi:ATP-dependent protease HslVU (ClpYQ) peptidase subunit